VKKGLRFWIVWDFRTENNKESFFSEGGESKDDKSKKEANALRVIAKHKDRPENRTLYNKEGGDLRRWKNENQETFLKASLIHFTKEFVK
jgi:hypothetical protein